MDGACCSELIGMLSRLVRHHTAGDPVLQSVAEAADFNCERVGEQRLSDLQILENWLVHKLTGVAVGKRGQCKTLSRPMPQHEGFFKHRVAGPVTVGEAQAIVSWDLNSYL